MHDMERKSLGGAPWLYVHGGLREQQSKWIPIPGKKSGDAYIMEAIEKHWTPVFPAPGKEPRVLRGLALVSSGRRRRWRRPRRSGPARHRGCG